MKKILFSILSLGVVAVVAIGATRAYFNDTEVLGDNAITTGELSITDSRLSYQLDVDLTNLKPGGFKRMWVRIQNDGTLDVGSLKITAINKVGDLELLENVNVTVYNTVDGYSQGIFTPAWGTGQPITPWLDGIDVLGDPVYSGGPTGEVMIPGSESSIILDFRVPTSVGNDLQGKAATFDLEFFAEQVI
jgi:predicted ribosomally synthesized peptide with SipW-like signal peptide